MTTDPSARGLALIGYRGTGKSTVGRMVADRLRYRFVDADRVLESRSGRSILSIFAEEGEAVFRDLEEEVLRDLTKDPRTGLVLATGGGAVLRESNRRALRDFGLVVWLRADPEVLAGRIRNHPRSRPSLTEAGVLDEIADVLRERTPLYEEAAHATVETAGLAPRQVVEAVIAAWLNHRTAEGARS